MIEPALNSVHAQCVLFDWGDTVMRNFPQSEGPMHLWPRVEAVPGIQAALEILRLSSILALATNAADSDQSDIRMALERCDLSRFIDVVYCFRQLGHRKPEAAFYRAILDRLDLEVSSVFMVGDTFGSDVQAANEVGIPAVWFNPHTEDSNTGPLHRTIHDFEALPSALRALGANLG